MLRLCCAIAALGFLSLAPDSYGQTEDLAGKYECAQVRVKGVSRACSSAPLTLDKSGKFELRGWEGTYLVNGQWVELSSEVLKSKAKIEKGYRIVFRYTSKEGVVEMVYVRRTAMLGKLQLG